MSSAADFVASKRFSTVLLYAIVGAWLAYRLIMLTLMGRFLVGVPLDIDGLLRKAMLAIILFSELCRIWRREYGRTDAVAILILVVMVWGLHINGHISLLYDAIAVFALRNESPRHVVLFGSIVIGACATLAVLSVALAIVPEIVDNQDGRIRHFLGFVYCLFGPQVLFAITCAVCWLLDGKMKWWVLAVLAVLNVAFFVLTNSRLSFGLSMLVIGFSLARMVWKSEAGWKSIARCASWSFVFVAVVSVLAVSVFALQVESGEHWLDKANQMFGLRISFAYYGVEDMGIEPFGQKVTWIGNGRDVFGNGDPNIAHYNYVDNQIFHALIEDGIVYTLGMVLLYTFVARKSFRTNDYMLTVVLMVIALHWLIDDLALNAYFNPFVFLCGAYLVFGATSESSCVSCTQVGES